MVSPGFLDAPSQVGLKPLGPLNFCVYSQDRVKRFFITETIHPELRTSFTFVLFDSQISTVLQYFNINKFLPKYSMCLSSKNTQIIIFFPAYTWTLAFYVLIF